MNAAVFRSISGKRHDLFAPSADAIDFDEMAVQLSRINRYTGATHPREYNVAQHSVHVTDALSQAGHGPEVQLAGLLHDGHEYLIGDVTISLENRLGPAGRAELNAARADCDRVIHQKLGLAWPLPQEAYEAVNFAHDRVVLAEMLDLTRGFEDTIAEMRHRGVVRIPQHIRPRTAELAREAFLMRFTALAAALNLQVG